METLLSIRGKKGNLIWKAKNKYIVNERVTTMENISIVW